MAAIAYWILHQLIIASQGRDSLLKKAVGSDWKGKMSSDYKMKSDVSNVVIIDKTGRIRFYTSGEVKAEEINDVKELLIALARE